METFPFIANNFIRTIRKCLAVLMAGLLMGILCLGCSRSMVMETQEDETVQTEETAPDASDCEEQSEDSQRDLPNNVVYMADANQPSTTPENHEALLRDHNRTEMNLRVLQCRAQEGKEWVAHIYDLLCKLYVSESKVRQGIFHFRLQSDDEEAPNLKMIA